MINNVKHHKQLPVYGDGMQIRDWLYVEDHCKAIDMVAEGGKIGEVYNVAAKRAAQHLHRQDHHLPAPRPPAGRRHQRGPHQARADRLGHDRRYGIDPTKIKNDLGWYPETPFEKGIVLTIDWYLAHEDWMNNVTSGNYQKYYEEMYKNK